MEPTRRLSAILFADIAGYTALMQKDEKAALFKLKRYQDVLAQAVKEHHGEIVKNYGDGSICLFPTASGALFSSLQIQQSLKKNPAVPLRIGLHLGDVTITEDDVYGDAVNIASRIETMGIPGNVLLSGSFHQKVKNQTSVSFSSLGKFELKHVDEGLEIYAVTNKGIVVPTRGQLKEKTATYKSLNELVKWVLPIIIIFLLFILYKFYFSGNKPTATTSADFIDKAQIAIGVFDNNSRDPSYDIIGKMAADWITHGIIENKIASVISYETINEYQKVAMAGFNLQDIRNNLGGPIKLIKGAYYVVDTTLIFQSSIVDQESNKPIFAFETVSCPADKPLEGIEKLKELIFGYWASQDFTFMSSQPPTFTAYVLFLKAKDYWSKDFALADSLLRQSLAEDPAFLHAKYLLAHLYYNASNFPVMDSLVTDLASDIDLKNPIQANALNYLRALLAGNNKRIFETYQNEYATAPNDLFKNTAMMVIAMDYIKDPELTVETFNILNHDIFDYGNCYYCVVRVEVMARALVLLNRYEEVIELLEPITVQTDKRGPFDILLKAYIRTNNFEKLDNLLQSASQTTLNRDVNYLYFLSAYDAQLIGLEKYKKKYAELAIRRYESADYRNLIMIARSYYLLEDYVKSQKLFEEYLGDNPSNIFSLGKLASIAFLKNEEEKALSIIKKIESIQTDWDYGYTPYIIAQAYSTGEKYDLAFDYLKKAIASGDRGSNIDYEFDPVYRKMHTMPEWQDIMNYWK